MDRLLGALRVLSKHRLRKDLLVVVRQRERVRQYWRRRWVKLELEEFQFDEQIGE